MLEKDTTIFHPITLKDKEWVMEKLKQEEFAACEYTFANNFLWSEVYEVEVGMIYGCGLIRYKEQGEEKYSFPFGTGDKKKAIQWLREICKKKGTKLEMYPVLEEERKQLLEWFPGEFYMDSNRADFDYIYTVEKLSLLRGKKLHGKRNHIARFKDEEDWCYETLKKENIEECRNMLKLWTAQREEKWNLEMDQEANVLEKAFSHYEELGLLGGILRKKGEIVAFTIGEPLNSNTLVVHFEKAFPQVQGAYPMINQQFVLQEGQAYSYVNREEDTGDISLRKAKLSYYPDILLKKYNAIESPIVYASEQDKEHVIRIWQECFSDPKEYITMYLTKRCEEETMLVMYKEEKPVSMASFLPVKIRMEGELIEARYVYAVGTLPEERRNGYAKELIKFAASQYEVPLILQPASEDLEKYYETLGFESCFCTSPCWRYEGNSDWKKENIEFLKEGMLGRWEIKHPTTAEYKRIRDAYFEDEGYVEWDETGIQYAIEENAFREGQTWKLSYLDRVELLMYRVEDGELCIVETTLTEEELRLVLPELMKKIGVCKAYSSNGGGMILLPKQMEWKEKTGYFNLTLG